MHRLRLGSALLLVTGLLVGLGLGWAVLSGSSSTHPGTVATSDEAASPSEERGAVLQGRTVPVESPALLCGRVSRADGGPPSEVEIYLIEKSKTTDSRPAVVVTPHADGRWSLGAADPTGHWVAAIAEGLAPAFVDGDGWTGESIALTVPAGRAITVYVDDRELLVGGAVRLVSTPPAGSTSAWPRPGECRPFRQEVLFDLGGETLVRAPTEGPVRLEISGSGVRGQPAERVVKPDSSVTEFNLRTSCLLEIRATDAETGWNLEMKARATVPDFVIEEPPYEPFKLEDIDVHHLMDYMYMNGLPCGRYGVRVWCDGYLPFVASDLDLERPGSHVIVDAALRPDPRLGRLEVRMTVPGQGGLGELEPYLLLRRLDEEPGSDPDWEWKWPRTLDRESGRAVIGPLHPGPYEVYVWCGARLVGRTRTHVVGARTAEAAAVLAPGLMVDLLRGEKLDPGRSGEWTSVRLVDGRGEPLPPVRFGRHQPPTRVKEEDRDYYAPCAGMTVPLDAVLGPLPADEVFVTAGRDDHERRWTVTARED